jgi:hypothetical protein
VRRRERAGRALSDAELLDAYDEWRRAHPRPPVSESDEASLQAWQAWRDQYKAWMDEQGTSFDELDRLQHHGAPALGGRAGGPRVGRCGCAAVAAVAAGPDVVAVPVVQQDHGAV